MGDPGSPASSSHPAGVSLPAAGAGAGAAGGAPLVPMLALAVLLAAGCLPPQPPPGPGVLRTGIVRILAGVDTAVLRVEVAETPEQQRIGLMGRGELPADGGMIFLFAEEQPPDTELWMYRTPVPLSAALLDAEGTIRGIVDLEPCSSRISLLCPRYAAGIAFHSVLEVNRGFFARQGIGPGARVVLRMDPAVPMAPAAVPSGRNP